MARKNPTGVGLGKGGMSVAMERRESPWKGNGVATGNVGWGGRLLAHEKERRWRSRWG